MNPDVVEIIKQWLREHGYDGLFCPSEWEEDNCGCGLDDFMPCGLIGGCGMTEQCRAAYRHSDGMFHLEKEEANA